jgi:hypothetical protein
MNHAVTNASDDLVMLGIVCVGIGMAIVISAFAAGLFHRHHPVCEDRPKRLTNAERARLYPAIAERIERQLGR